MKKFRWLGLVAFLSFFIISCTKTDVVSNNDLYIPSSADVTATATLSELTQGRQLFIDNCNSCHQLYNPDSFSSSQWSSIIASMAPRTPMTSSEAQLVLKYVTRGN